MIDPSLKWKGDVLKPGEHPMCIATIKDYPLPLTSPCKWHMASQNVPLCSCCSTMLTAELMLKLLHELQPLVACRSRGGLDAERAERIKCKQEDTDRDRRNFEAMQVSLHSQHSPTLISTSLQFLPLPSSHSCTHYTHNFASEKLCAPSVVPPCPCL